MNIALTSRVMLYHNYPVRVCPAGYAFGRVSLCMYIYIFVVVVVVVVVDIYMYMSIYLYMSTKTGFLVPYHLKIC